MCVYFFAPVPVSYAQIILQYVIATDIDHVNKCSVQSYRHAFNYVLTTTIKLVLGHENSSAGDFSPKVFSICIDSIAVLRSQPENIESECNSLIS